MRKTIAELLAMDAEPAMEKTINCGVCGYRGEYNETEWWHHLWRKCRETMVGRMY
jgi:hypothetical protein